MQGAGVRKSKPQLLMEQGKEGIFLPKCACAQTPATTQ